VRTNEWTANEGNYIQGGYEEVLSLGAGIFMILKQARLRLRGVSKVWRYGNLAMRVSGPELHKTFNETLKFINRY
jgi:hypothetical protein